MLPVPKSLCGRNIHEYTIFYKYHFSRHSLDDALTKPLHTGGEDSELRSCVEVEVAVLCSPSLKVSVDVKQR